MGTCKIKHDRPVQEALMGTCKIKHDRPVQEALMGTCKIKHDRPVQEALMWTCKLFTSSDRLWLKVVCFKTRVNMSSCVVRCL